MTADWPWGALSGRAQQFFGAWASIDRPSAPPVITSGQLTREAGWPSFASQLEELNDRYAGIRFPILGGQLAGEMRLGSAGRDNAWKTGDGLLVARIASHDTAQCAFVLSADEQFGCSWTGEFTPLFDSIGCMLEDVAVWGFLQGWHYVAFLDAHPSEMREIFGNLTLDPDASGEISQWWFGKGLAISAARYLNPRRSALPQITVLAESASTAAEACARVRVASKSVGIASVIAPLGQVPLLPQLDGAGPTELRDRVD